METVVWLKEKKKKKKHSTELVSQSYQYLVFLFTQLVKQTGF